MTYNYDHLKEKQPTGLTAELLEEISSDNDVTLHEKRWSNKSAMVEFTHTDNKKYRINIEEID